MFESFMLRGKTKTEICQELEREREKEEARLAALKLEGKDITQEKVAAAKKLSQQFDEKVRSEIAANFLLAVVWSYGVALEEKHARNVFNERFF